MALYIFIGVLWLLLVALVLRLAVIMEHRHEWIEGRMEDIVERLKGLDYHMNYKNEWGHIGLLRDQILLSHEFSEQKIIDTLTEVIKQTAANKEQEGGAQ